MSKISRLLKNGIHPGNSRSGIKETGHHPVLPQIMSDGKIPTRSHFTGRPAKHGRRLSIEDDLYSTLCACEVSQNKTKPEAFTK